VLLVLFLLCGAVVDAGYWAVKAFTGGVSSALAQMTNKPVPPDDPTHDGEPEVTRKETVVFTTVAPPGKDVRVGIGVMNADGSGRTILAEGPAGELMCPTLSSDGKRIAFAALSRDHRSADIYVMNRDGSGRKQLTEQDPKTYATAPAWSSDGRRIAYEVRQGTLLEGKEGTHLYSNVEEIAVMDADGKNVRTVGKGTKPAWSPNGKKLLFTAVDDKLQTTLSVMDADGKSAEELVKGSGDGAWSPDGKRVAYLLSKTHSLHVCNADGSESRLVLKGDDAPVLGLAWSADAKRLYVNRVPDPKTISAPIFVVDADGQNLKQLTKGEHLDALAAFDGVISTARRAR
jgi:Tol biopolymer transport system component